MTQLALSRAVLDRLAHVSTARGAPSLGDRLATLDRWVRADLIAFEAELSAIPRGTRVVHAAAHHLLDLRGKHLRPLCVALASRFGDGFTDQARALAVAVEMVHSATLLHDDVVDVAEHRRGQPAACVVYGNAASIFAGDWLLVAALRRIAAAGVDGMLDRMLAVIDEMIVAESIQLERRGNVTGSREDYFAIVEGKTAALFRWAMIAGARVARLPAAAEAALERFGLHLGVAFQAVDDELDYADERSEAVGAVSWTRQAAEAGRGGVGPRPALPAGRGANPPVGSPGPGRTRWSIYAKASSPIRWSSRWSATRRCTAGWSRCSPSPRRGTT